VVAQVLMIDGEPLDPALGLFDLGLDSLMALEVRNRLAAALETELPATLLFEHPSIEAVAVYLRTDVLADRPEAGSTPPEPSADDGLESLLDDLDRLSDEEIELRLTGQPAGKEHPR
jgi:acyl carrier protein